MSTLAELPAAPSGRNGWPWTEASPPLPPTLPDGSPWPAFTLVTPSYNQASFLEETIRSVLLQGYPRLQYVVVDGGSTDGSVDIIQRYAPWLAHWTSERDQGQSDAINKGLRLATGDLVAWLNSDDTYLPAALSSTAAHFAVRPDLDFVYRDCWYTDPDGRNLSPGYGRPYRFEELLRFSIPYQPASFWRRSAMERTGLLDPAFHYSMDSEYWVRMASMGAQFAYLPGFVATYRLHQDSKTVAAVPRMYSDWERIINRHAPVAQRPGLLADAQLLTAMRLAEGRNLRESWAYVRAANRLAYRKRLLAYACTVMDALTGGSLGHRLLQRWMVSQRLAAAGPGAPA